MSRSADLDKVDMLRRSGQPESAAEALRAYVRKNPTDAEARRQLAGLLVEMHNVDGAISVLVKLQELLSETGDVLGAISAGLKVIELDPEFDNPLAHVAKLKLESLRSAQQQRQALTVPVAPITPLNEIPLLSELSPEEIATVAASMKRHEVAEGEAVFQEGDPGDSIFFVTRGLLEVQSGGNKLGLVPAGQCLGEFSFFTREPRTASVRAMEDSELLELSADAMRDVARNHSRIREVLFAMYRDRALVNVLSMSPLFQVLPSKDRARLAPRFRLVTLAPGDAAFEEGEQDGSIYLVKEGSLEVKATIDGETIVLARLGRHQFFGEVSFLTGVPRTASVHALEYTELLEIEEAELREILRHHPYMRDVLSQYHMDRVTATAETLKAFLKRDRVDGLLS
jgi:cAMP-dependent protein kinase regulator